MQRPTSPRLPGVPILRLDATGAEYSRWRRGVKFALETKGTWKYCNGEASMPMPEKTSTKQPSLLEERRAWVRHDREAKLDIYLSLTEEVMLDLFEVGPPLPPSNRSAQDILEALDEHFASFKFEAYHHAFCHFLNLHIDQYATMAEFNVEFATTLEDLVDYGHPLSNTQACSAYLSKLRCTQNTWVGEVLQEWDAQDCEPQLIDLMSESLVWEPVRPLSLRLPRPLHEESIPDETYDSGSVRSSIEATMMFPHVNRMSSKLSHSRNTSTNTTASEVRSITKSLGNVVESESPVVYRHSSDLPITTILQREKARTCSAPTRSISELNVPSHQTNVELVQDPRSRSASPRLSGVTYKNSSRTLLDEPMPSRPLTTLSLSLPSLGSDRMNPTLIPTESRSTLQLRSQLEPPSPPPLSEHPAFRMAQPTTNEQHIEEEKITDSTTQPYSPISALSPSFTTFSPPLHAIHNSSSPDLSRSPSPQQNTPQRPHSSRADMPTTQPPKPHIQQPPVPTIPSPYSSTTTSTANNNNSNNSSTLSLPLQGIQPSSWDYQHHKNNNDNNNNNNNNNNTPLNQTNPHLTLNPNHIHPQSNLHCISPVQSLSHSNSMTALPQIPVSHARILGKYTGAKGSTSKTRSLGKEVARRGEALYGRGQGRGGDGVGRGILLKKKAWSVGAHFARFSHSKGVKEII